MFLIPMVFCRRVPTEEFETTMFEDAGSKGEGEDNRGKKSQAETQGDAAAIFVLPVVLLHCHQDILLDPDPANPNPPSQLPDLYQHLTLHLSHSPSPPSSSSSSSSSSSFITQDVTNSPQSSLKSAAQPNALERLYTALANEGLRKFVSKLRAIHFSSYLHSLHTTLTQKKPVPPDGFYAAIEICKRSTLSIDCTSLVAAFCRHAQARLQPPLASETERVEAKDTSVSSDLLAQLLEGISSKAQSHCKVSYVDSADCLPGSTHCVRWEGELEQMFKYYLFEVGFEKVPHCEGYYWLRGEEAVKSLMRGTQV